MTPNRGDDLIYVCNDVAQMARHAVNTGLTSKAPAERQGASYPLRGERLRRRSKPEHGICELLLPDRVCWQGERTVDAGPVDDMVGVERGLPREVGIGRDEYAAACC